jgi:two-component system, NtrC family, sensor kinase
VLTILLSIVICVQMILIAVLLRNRRRYKLTKRLLKESQRDLEIRVNERTEKLRTINNKLYEEIAKHETTEELLRDSQDYVQSIINSMPSILIGVTPTGVITHWNSAAEQSTDTSAAQAMGRPLMDVYRDLPLTLAQIKDAIRTHVSNVKENMLLDDGTYIDVSVYPLQSNKLTGAVIRIEDVTLKVQMEYMMIHNEKMLSLGELAAGTAHEINNPLSAILQGVQNIRRRLSESLEKNHTAALQVGVSLADVNAYLKAREIDVFVNHIQEAGERASQIVRNMLEFSRANDPELHPIDLIQLTDHTLELASHSFSTDVGASMDKIAVTRDYATDMPLVNCVGAEIQQVLLNLLRNAAQVLSTTKQPKIHVRIWHDNNYAMLEVSDNGPGIPEAIKRRIFEPFFTTKKVGDGTGLGLSVSYFIVTEHHGGMIEVDSEQDQGTRFVVRLPLL